MADRQTKVTISAQMSQYISEFEKAAKATRKLKDEGDKLGEQREAFERLGRSALIAGTAITAATALSIKAAVDWESAWTGVTKTVDGSADEMAILEDQLRSLATTLPATHQEIAAVAEAAGQLGVAREDVAAFTKTMIDLAETTNLTADEAATSIAQFMNIMQSAPEDVDNLGAALVALGNDGASTERDIVQMAQNIAGAGKIVGLTEAQVLGLANALASVGIDAEAGGSSVSKVMTDIAMAVSQGGDELEKFAEVAGMSSSQFQKAFKEDPADAIATFIEGLARIDAKGGDVFKTLSDLGQTDIRVSRALLGMANSGDLLRESLELGSEAWEDNIALAEEARKRYQTTEAQLQIAGNAIYDAAINLGEVFLPAVKDGAQAVTGMANAFGDLPDPVQGLIGIFGGVAGAIALAGGAALLAVPKIAEFRVAMQTLNTSVGSIGLIGGGVAVALTGLLAVVGHLASEQARAQANAESYARALEQGADAANDVARENLAVERSLFGLNFGSAYDNAEKLGIGLDTVYEAATGSKEALKELNKVLDVAAEGGSAAQKMADELGISYLDLVQSAATLRGAVEDEAAGRDRGNEILRQTKEAADDTTPSVEEAARATKQLAGDADQAASDLSDMEKALRDVGGTAMGMGEAVDRAQGALNRMAEAAEAEGVSIEGLDDASISFRDSMREVETAHRDAAESIVKNGGTLEDATAKYYEGRDAVVEMLKAKGLDEDAARTWAEENYGAADEVVQALGNVERAVSNIPERRVIQLVADTAPAMAKINEFVWSQNGRRINLVVDGYSGRQVAGSNTIARASGGPVYGPGSGTSDSVPAMLSNGEHVWTTAEVDAAGGHKGVEAIRRWVRTGAGIPMAGAGDSRQPVQINQSIHPAPGMSEVQIGRIAAEQAAFAYRGAGT